MSVSSLTTLGTTLAATCSTDPAGRLAAGTLGAAVICVPPGGCPAWPTARRRRRCRPTPPRSSTRRPSMRLRGNASAAARVAEEATAGAAAPERLGTGRMPGGRPAAVAGWRSASRAAAVADSRYARTARDIPPCGHRLACGPAGAAAVSTSGGSSCRNGLFLRVRDNADTSTTKFCCPTVPGWAENPLRECSAHPQISGRSGSIAHPLSALATGCATSAGRVAEISRPGSST